MTVSGWRGARQEHKQSSSSDEFNLVKKEEGALIRSDYREKTAMEGKEYFQ